MGVTQLVHPTTRCVCGFPTIALRQSAPSDVHRLFSLRIPDSLRIYRLYGPRFCPHSCLLSIFLYYLDQFAILQSITQQKRRLRAQTTVTKPANQQIWAYLSIGLALVIIGIYILYIQYEPIHDPCQTISPARDHLLRMSRRIYHN